MAKASRSERVNSVIRVAEDAERKALAELVKCREEVQGQELKLEELISYRDEYHQGARESVGVTSVQTIQNRFSFMQKLETAIDGQRQQIVTWGDQEEHLRKIWIEKRVRCRALNKASEQRIEQFRKEQKRAEQKKMDDLVLKR